ncbi:unnamed protein product [Enterobius vermicularis]|uniref:CUB domain-containing protein n=1 Tax=Enterobius vermicularis TaxID=51028 RepID=A0A0N4V6S6_ENTVE|nr:unnamed protein product [Enterobius vermicularis]
MGRPRRSLHLVGSRRKQIRVLNRAAAQGHSHDKRGEFHVAILYYTPCDYINYKPTGYKLYFRDFSSCSNNGTPTGIELIEFRDNCSRDTCLHGGFYRHANSNLCIVTDTEISPDPAFLRLFQFRLTVDAKELGYEDYTFVRRLASLLQPQNLEFCASYYYGDITEFEFVSGSFVGLKPDTVGTIIDDYWTVIRDAEHGNEKSFENQKSLIKYSFENVEGSFEVELPELSEDTAVEIIKYAVQVFSTSRNLPRKARISSFLASPVKDALPVIARRLSSPLIKINVHRERFSLRFQRRANRFLRA